MATFYFLIWLQIELLGVQLGHDVFTIRQRAEASLMAMPNWTLPYMKTIYERTKDPEIMLRLRRVMDSKGYEELPFPSSVPETHRTARPHVPRKIAKKRHK